MNPDQNEYSIDYLNQIAPEQKKPGLGNKTFLMLVGGGVLLAIIGGIFILSSGSSNGPKDKMQTLAARMETLQTISSKAQKNIKSGDLRSANSNLTIFLTNANRDIVDPLEKNGVDLEKPDKTIVAAEKGEELSKKLEDARLNAVFDRIYAREMVYQLDTVAALMQDIYGRTKSKSLQEFLLKTDDNLQPIKEQLHDFNMSSQ